MPQDTNPELRHLALMAQPINSIDITGVEAFARLEKVVAKRGGMIHVVGMKLPGGAAPQTRRPAQRQSAPAAVPH